MHRFRNVVWMSLALTLALRSASGAEARKPVPGSVRNPVLVPLAADTITVDGDLADWAKIQALPVPFAKKEAGAVKLAWTEAGLFGGVQVKDAKIALEEGTPWSADCIELWFELDGLRAEEMGAYGCQMALAPNPQAGAGKAIVVVAQGPIAKGEVKASWKPVEGGYQIEFFIPAKELKPAKLAEGTKVGFNYSVDDDGKAVEEFFYDKDTDNAFSNPSVWGVIQLGKAPSAGETDTEHKWKLQEQE